MNNRTTAALHLGAAYVAAFDLGVPVAQVTVRPCNRALGFVQVGPDRHPVLRALGFVQLGPDRHPVLTLSELEARLKVAVASFVGEDMFIGARSTSSCTDMERAQRIAEQMRECGDTREAQDIIKAAMDSVRVTLAANERNVHRIAEALVREGTLNAHELQQVIGGE